MFSRPATLFVAIAVAMSGQSLSRKIDLPADSPITLVSADWGDSKATPRGGAYLVDVHAALSLRNSSQRRIRAVTMVVVAQDVTPGGKGSVSPSSLDVAPNETFPLRIDLQLLRPLGAGQGGPGVEVTLDGVLFDDLNFYGPDKLHSRRTMTVWELEARRDRRYFKTLLERAGREALQNEMLNSLAREAERPRPGVQFARGRATLAHIAGNEARAPRVEVRNRSERAIRYLEIGWIVKDQQGHEFLAALMPADLNLGPGRIGQVVQDAALRFPDRTSVEAMTGYVASVEFADGSYWVPSRTSLEDPKLRRLVAPSPEEQRLASIYRKKGLGALVEELKKF